MDNRIKHTEEQKMRVIKLYLKNIGIISIEKIEEIHNSVISSWIKNMEKIIKEETSIK